jgi:hypothetical protein
MVAEVYSTRSHESRASQREQRKEKAAPECEGRVGFGRVRHVSEEEK